MFAIFGDRMTEWIWTLLRLEAPVSCDVTSISGTCHACQWLNFEIGIACLRSVLAYALLPSTEDTARAMSNYCIYLSLPHRFRCGYSQRVTRAHTEPQGRLVSCNAARAPGSGLQKKRHDGVTGWQTAKPWTAPMVESCSSFVPRHPQVTVDQQSCRCFEYEAGATRARRILST